MSKKPYIIVLGNEKGGTGKSTLSTHLIVSLLRMEFNVGSIDVDARQGTLSRYIENRKITSATLSKPLPIPTHLPLFPSQNNSKDVAAKEDQQNLDEAIAQLSSNHFIVIDTPGSDSALSRAAHSVANMLITPLNDSFIDLDILARLKKDTLEIIRPSTYSEMVWDQKKHRAIRDKGTIEWVVLRNRLSSINARNKKQMDGVMQTLAKRIGFRYISGFGERVIFRELFLSGLTVLDLADCKIPLSLSHVTARQELRKIIHMLQLPEVERLAA